MNTKDRQEVNQCKSSLRFAIMCNGTIFPKRQAECLKKILELSNVHAVLLILDDDNVISKNFLVRVFTKLKNLRAILFGLYCYLIVRPSSFRPVDMTNSLSDLSSIRCRVSKRGECSGYFSDEDIIRIKQFDLDFILRFGFKDVCGDILNAARHGVWSFHLSDEMKYGGVPSCFWEIYDGDPIIGATLKRLTDQSDRDIVLRKGFFPTILYSYGANLHRILLETSCWPAQVCIDILNNRNIDYLNAPTSPTTAPIYCAPNNFQMALFLLKLLRNRIIKIYNRFFCHQEWNIGIIREPISVLLKAQTSPKIHWLSKQPKNHFLADPFAISRDNKIYILCEDFDYRSNKGVISSIELNGSCSIVKKEIALRAPFHLAYPFLFEHQNEFYCVPETSDAREVALYKAEHFPSRWTKVCVLIEDFPGVDNTIFQYGGRWWLACAKQENGINYKLFLWHSPNLTGPWRPHELNPVKLDVRSARPAGTPFMLDGFLYRPAQDCSVTYGGRIVLNRVVRLTPTAFEEEPALSIEPDKGGRYPDGLHTISVTENAIVVDGKRRVFLIRGFINGVRDVLNID